MVFSSFVFLFLFLPAVLAVYFLCRGTTARNAVLCVFSLVFYAWGEPVYILLMLASILLNYCVGLVLGKTAKKGARRALMILALVINLGAIGFFKYGGFVVTNINALAGLQLTVPLLDLPIGISFYTFQILSYVIDVYRGQTKAQRSLLSLTTYIALFPQLVAGPIVRYETVERELKERTVTPSDFTQGIARFIIGLGKKVLIANCMASMADRVFDAAVTPAGGAAWLGAIAYMLQIYFDFSGYSDMAIGMGRMFGFHFLENFNRPYLAVSVTDFWRRWHISLSEWFRDYVYIPLGGNRVPVPRQVLNLLVVWTLTGLWHGASWTFVLWGAYYSVLLILEKFVLKDALKRVPAVLRHIGTLLLVLFGWILFRVESVSALPQFIGAMFSFSQANTGAYLLASDDALRFLVWLPVAVACCLPLGEKLGARFSQRGWYRAAYMLSLAAVYYASIASLLGSTYNPFIYFRF